MLDQQVIALANDQISLELVEQNKRINHDINRIKSEMAVRGSLQSGATIQKITSLCADATKDRAQMTWALLFRYLTTVGIKYYHGLSEEIKRIVAQHLPESLDDLKGYAKKHTEVLGSQNLDSYIQQEIEDARITALAKVNGSIDLFVIALREREKMPNEQSDQNVFNIYSPVGAIQTGDNAIAYPIQYLDASTQERLLTALKVVEEALDKTDSLPSHPKSEIVDLVQESQLEIQKVNPNTTKLRSLLSTVASSIRTVASLRPAYETLKTVLVYFGIHLP